jgi:hypothetical protein
MKLPQKLLLPLLTAALALSRPTAAGAKIIPVADGDDLQL